MRIVIDPERPNFRLLNPVVEQMQKGEVVIIPTDTSYAFACSIQSKKAMQEIYQLKEINWKEPLTFLSESFAQTQEYIQACSNPVYRQIRKITPGRYTFIFHASKLTPNRLLNRRKQIGVRIPNAPIANHLIQKLEEIILISSVPKKDLEDTHHYAYHIYESYFKRVACIVDIGDIFIQESSIIDFTESPPTLIRQGDSDTSWLANFE